MVKPLGQIAVFGLPPTMERVPFDWDTFFRQRLDIHTVFGAQDEPGLPAFQLAVDFIQSGEIDMEPFVTHQYPISRVQEAFDLADAKGDGASPKGRGDKSESAYPAQLSRRTTSADRPRRESA